ncbi:MAG: hypothetical protein LBE92_06855 [Chryseobacterium sp.]|jgi:hypothetical protein|uniref:hypothetical protein n=1 Tax=Chryseobacterium sp. TaxID=1871047 RepID=UPI0028290BDB|nr:hypothetical protein [Chryseobacterium sp.]MDR2235825.1 hypothetical protein [Chryseobacterium sp.]
MAFVLIAAALSGVANFYYWVFQAPMKTCKLFLIFFMVVSLIAFITDSDRFLEGWVTFSGYYTLLFLVHLLLTKGFGIRRYWPYVSLFSLISLLATAFFAVLMQDIFNYS